MLSQKYNSLNTDSSILCFSALFKEIFYCKIIKKKVMPILFFNPFPSLSAVHKMSHAMPHVIKFS
jgi:hypothetical protein